AFFVRRLSSDGLPLASLLLNRPHPLPDGPPARLDADEAARAARVLAGTGRHPVAEAALRLHAERARTRERELLLRARLLTEHPGVRGSEVAALTGDVLDLPGLHRIGMRLDVAGPADAGTRGGTARTASRMIPGCPT